MTSFSRMLGYLCVAAVLSTPAMAQPAGDGRPPGRPVKVAAIAIGFGGEREAKLKLALEHLTTAGSAGVDIACLPEEFAGYETAEPLNGPIVTAVAAVAKTHHMYVVCPIREQADDGRMYNTAVLIDREGQTIGWYRKVFVFWTEGLNLSSEGVKTFDLDFGRISILTCFDINFAELWQEVERQGAEIVFWPSAYGGGMPLTGYAMCHNYYIVPVGRGNMIDIDGKLMESVEKPRPDQFTAVLDLDRVLVHRNFATEKVAKMLQEHRGEIEIERSFEEESWDLFRSLKPGVLVRDLLKQYGIETLREYRQRSREQINQARKEGKRI